MRSPCCLCIYLSLYGLLIHENQKNEVLWICISFAVARTDIRKKEGCTRHFMRCLTHFNISQTYRPPMACYWHNFTLLVVLDASKRIFLPGSFNHIETYRAVLSSNKLRVNAFLGRWEKGQVHSIHRTSLNFTDLPISIGVFVIHNVTDAGSTLHSFVLILTFLLVMQFLILISMVGIGTRIIWMQTTKPHV
jgi:hypothetical protein